MKTRQPLLVKLLSALLEEWGADEVRSALDKAIAHASQGIEQDKWGARSEVQRAPRLTAIQLVDRLDIQSDMKRLLSTLASRFDDKDFLPSVADVREFIIMAGERPPTMKNRQESFRILMRVLLRLPPERLKHVAEEAIHSGPAQLGPISDAITAAGDRLPRRTHDQERERN